RLEAVPAVAMSFFGDFGFLPPEENFDPDGLGTSAGHTSTILIWCKPCFEKILRPIIYIEHRKGRTSNG
ncbi:MAG: hypothetical protein KDB07_05425, partial [Planctomycetes bacterium]|nr:hypothetical protein [Planctomycetota bacterium]